MTIHREIAVEDGICAHLVAHDWLFEQGVATRYDCARALFPKGLAA